MFNPTLKTKLLSAFKKDSYILFVGDTDPDPLQSAAHFRTKKRDDNAAIYFFLKRYFIKRRNRYE